ncbi:CDP-diacylglycerol--glycerol-3-phosphate 3-phosphatidyltransferase [Mycoplasma sp. Mirounga ES2805-ORL]|uniref:CDP-diacylglycerol--glycerol-3-phosphate 3-phosphatidyltransferase n=1 Tax=Mycoplasma sp. Mirounga ES2805-ORL TaxID=754514 RepID=UPI00197B3800|nr:CDP-diacylglycerol--glycerol-3-phosphate 3-phosphatidyltransferase [Mycoplasma sp. Mirounga ES2805-ORL]QSF13839.1 CDP-diacylglycerol--glycerol-3-phosphate 3-phosphatidyltransferase [Mycoplasma sp. Mirounga ES2805-ORL]
MNLPNKLTLLRLILVVPLIITFIAFGILFKKYNITNSNGYLENGHELYGRILLSIILIIFVVAMITDFFDGYTARKNNLVTSFGKLWDPLADKVVVTSTMIFLAVFKFIPFWIIIIYVLRDIIVDGCRISMAQFKIDVSASIFGKMKTLFQTIGIITILIVAIVIPYYPEYLVNIAKEKFTQEIYGYLMIYSINLFILIGLFFSIYSGILYIKKIAPHLQVK